MARAKLPPYTENDLNSESYNELSLHPNFMIRRAHQIATAIFTECCAEVGMTPSQYSMLHALQAHGAMGQNELARAVSLDRSTASLVVHNLLARSFIDKEHDLLDRRKSRLSITQAGRLALIAAERMNARAGEELMSAFSSQQARTFLKLLGTLNQWHSAHFETGDVVVGGEALKGAPTRRRA